MLVGVLLVTGVGLIAIPLLVPPDVPDSTVEFYVEAAWSDRADQTIVAYMNYSEAEREKFDEARRATPETITRSAWAAPESLTPPPDSIELFNVRDESAGYLLQGRYLTSDADILTQQLPRLVLLAGGVVCHVWAAYWRFEH